MGNLQTQQNSWDTFGIATVSILGTLVLVFAGLGGLAEETMPALPATTVTRAINTAVSVKAGQVTEVRVESETGVTKIDVEILAADNKKYEVSVNAQTSKVIAIEMENQDDQD